MGEWDVTMELLPHVHTLRLYLSPPLHSNLSLSSPPPLIASLHAPPPRLCCSWRGSSEPSQTLTLSLPLPPLLYDYSVPVHVSVQNGGCLEIRLQLLPVHHLQASSLVSPEEDKKSTNDTSHLSFDARMLSSLGDVVFYCRCCSKRLLKDSLRDNNIVEMPSVDWREVADSWFGPCCCSFGAKAELLVSQFKSQFSFGRLKERLGICLVGPASCYIHCGNIMPGCLLEKDLEADTRDWAVETAPDSKNESRRYRDDVVTVLSGDSCLGNLIPKELSSSPCFEHRDGNVGSDKPAGCASNGHFNIPKRVGEREEEFLIPDSCVGNLIPEKLASSPCLEHHDGNVSSDEPAGCASHGQFNIPKRVGEREEEFLIPGNGFIIRESEHSNSNKWVPLHCSNCSCLVGVSSNKGLDSGLGLHFFKFRISTSEVSGSEEDIFRVLKLENSVVKELQLLSDENTLYRYVIHGLNSKLPRLQLVVLNFNSWLCSSTCLISPVTDSGTAVSETSTHPTLKPVMKVMFVNCSDFSENAVRAVDEWVRKYDAEIIYMLEELVDSLTEVLYANKIYLPMLYSGQEFSLSFLERLNEQDLS